MLIKVILFLVAVQQSIAGKNCSLTLSNNTNSKVYINTFRWKLPLNSFNTTENTIKHGSLVQLTCGNGFVRDEFLGKSYMFECLDGRYNKTFAIEDLLCRSDFHQNTRTNRIPGINFGSKLFKCEGKNLEAYQVRAKKADGELKLLYTVCFDKNFMRTKFVFQPRRDTPPVKSNETRRDVWGFDQFGDSPGNKLKLSQGYVGKIQKKRITAAFPKKYDKNHPYPYTFNRGHLAAYADFTDADDKKASCLYINVAPQWREFNANSWSLVERATRDLIRPNPSDWEIYTGTYESIPTERGPLFVSPFFNENGKFVKGYVPVPRLYWKVVYNVNNRNDSRVFVGVNNPELKSPDSFARGYLVCQPIKDSKGETFHGNEFKGFTYECALDEFIKRLNNENIFKV